MCYNQTGNITTLDGTPLKLVDLGSSVSSIEKDIDMRLTKAWTIIDRLSIIWKSDLTNKMKCSFFQAAVISILLYGCTTWTLTKWLEKKLDGNYTRMLRAILNKSWWQHPTRHQLYGHLLPITKTIQVRKTRHAGHCWRSRDELINDVLLWTPTYGRVKAGRPARTYIQQLCEDTGCGPEDLPEAMNDREKWRERVRDIRACGTTWWWCMYIVQVVKLSSMDSRDKWILGIWLPTKPECSTRPFYRRTVHESSFIYGRYKKTWPGWHSPIKAPQTPNNQLNTTKQIKPGEIASWDQRFKRFPNT